MLNRTQLRNLTHLLWLYLALLPGNLPVSAQVPSLDQTQSPVNNMHHDWNSNSPNQGKAMKADLYQEGGQKIGPEKIGDQNSMPPGHASGDQKGNVESGGPQPCCEQNTKPQKMDPGCGQVTGSTTRCAITSDLGSQVNEKPYLQQTRQTLNYKNPEHNQATLGNLMTASGLGRTRSAGQSLQGASLLNSQMVPNASQSASIAAEAANEFVQKVPDPQGWSNVAKGVQQIQNAQNSDNQGNACKQNCGNAFNCMIIPLINVANENAATPTSSYAPFKDESNVIWMVQQMYKKCYLPMAVLFLLPGAVITQVKSLVAFSMLGTQDEDTSSPFIGMFRSMIAVFLIPATQLVVGYCIDIGNALTDPVAKRVQVETIMNWVNEQAYASDPRNNDNTIKNVAANMGKLAGTPSRSVVQERQNDLNVTVQNTLNTVNNLLSQGLEILNGFQIVMMCYLFLLGPIAAAFYAWPAAIGNSLFKKAFASWLDGVIVLSLWKFWWCIVLLCMVVRLQTGGVDPTSQYEMYYFTAFMTILVWVPFQPFEFRPGDMVDKVLEKAQGGGGGGAGAGGGKSGGASGQNGSPQAGGQVGGQNSGTAAQKGAGTARMDMGNDVAGGPKDSSDKSATQSAKESNTKGTDTEVADAGGFGPVKMNDDLSAPPSSQA